MSQACRLSLKLAKLVWTGGRAGRLLNIQVQEMLNLTIVIMNEDQHSQASLKDVAECLM